MKEAWKEERKRKEERKEGKERKERRKHGMKVAVDKIYMSTQKRDEQQIK